jgi:hypothetical protein
MTVSRLVEIIEHVGWRGKPMGSSWSLDDDSVEVASDDIIRRDRAASIHAQAAAQAAALAAMDDADRILLATEEEGGKSIST